MAKVYLAHGVWKGIANRIYPVQDTHESTTEELEEEIKIYNRVIKENFRDSRPYSWQRRFGGDAFHRQDIIADLRRDGKALLPQDGNCEGWGLSLSSLAEALELCIKSVEKYTREKEKKAQDEENYRQDLAAKARALPEEVQNKVVYYYFKQDYSYRAMHETYEGETTVKQLAEFFSELVEGTDEPGKVMPDKEYWDWSELFHEKWDAIQELLKEGTVVTAGEIGYHAISIVSAEAAKEAAKEHA